MKKKKEFHTCDSCHNGNCGCVGQEMTMECNKFKGFRGYKTIISKKKKVK